MKGSVLNKFNIFFKLTIILTIMAITILPTKAADIKWNKKTLLVCLPPNPNSEIMKKAFKTWQSQIKNRVTFNFLTANSCENAEITVSYSPNKTKSLTKFSYNGDYFIKAHIDIGFLDKNGKKSPPDLLYLIMQHEIGHAIGLQGHTNTPYSIMQPTVEEGYKITQDSINEIYRIYK